MGDGKDRARFYTYVASQAWGDKLWVVFLDAFSALRWTTTILRHNHSALMIAETQPISQGP